MKSLQKLKIFIMNKILWMEFVEKGFTILETFQNQNKIKIEAGT